MAKVSETRKLSNSHRKNANKVVLSEDSNDLFSDLTFLTSHVNVDHALLSLLLSDRITNSPFSKLYQRSQQVGWKQTLIEERNSIKVDPKSKLKRFMFNRLIYNAAELEPQVTQLNQMIASQMVNGLSVERYNYVQAQQTDVIPREIESWCQLQSRRRLLFENCDEPCNLIILQQLVTVRFMQLINLGSTCPEYDAMANLVQLVQRSFLIVTQPSGTDCLAVTKYEKQGKDFVAKVKTRIICLLDPNQVGKYFELFPIPVTLFLKEREKDPGGDVQSPLVWQTRTITDLEQNLKTFLYAELNENDWIHLTRKNSRGKRLYNSQLCQLDFLIQFKVRSLIDSHRSLTMHHVTLTSKSFGLCSHAKYYPKYLVKVFLEQMTDMYKDIDVETHINTLVECIAAFHKRITSVETKPHTTEFIHEQLQIVYQRFQNSLESITKPLAWTIYQDILEKLFTQIRFLGNHPFLSMLYEDSLFHGICSSTIDQDLQDSRTSKSCINAHYFIHDMCTCFSEARHNSARHLEIFHRDRTLPFSDFRQYYDIALSHDDSNETVGYEPLRPLLQRTIRNIQAPTSISFDQQNTLYLTGSEAENSNILDAAVEFLKQQLAQWCTMQNLQGTLTIGSTSTEQMIMDDSLTET